MRHIRQALSVTAYDYRMWKKNIRVIATFLLTFILCFLLTDKTVSLAQEHGTTMQMFESFIWTFGDSNSILLISLLLVLLFSLGSLTVFAVNRDLKDAIPLECDLRAFGNMKIAEHIVLHHDDVKAANTEDHPDAVAPKKGRGGKAEDGKVSVKLPALSWNVIRLEAK